MQLSPGVKDNLYGLWHGALRAAAPHRRDVLVWPPVESSRQLDDILPRLHFHFAARDPAARIVVTLKSKSIKPSGKTPYYLDQYSDRFDGRIVFRGAPRAGASLVRLAMSHRGVLLTRPAAEIPGGKWLQYLPNVAPFHPEDVEMETYWIAKLFHGPQARAVRAARRRFPRWRRRLPKRDKAYLLCTGPSLSRFAEFDFSDGYVIGCNSVVSNEKLMAHAKPEFIVACDPIFHFGPSIYAEQFRRDLATAAKTTPFQFLTLDAYHHLVGPHIAMPRERIGLVPITLQESIRPLTERWAVAQTANVMTMLMMPLAMTLAKEIYIIGADGREPGETYFWKHDPSSQLTDKMQAIKDCHPAFFEKRNYVDYYDTHCAIVQKWVDTIEGRGGHVYTLTPSYIPALAARPAPGMKDP